MDLRTLITQVQDAEHLAHLTHPQNLPSILQRGILSPLEARLLGARPGMGAKGSNESVVQLFDFGNLDPRGAMEHLKNVLEESPLLHPECIMFIIESGVRKGENFNSHWHVQRAATSHAPALRYYSPTEVWIDATTLAPQHIIQAWKIAATGKRLIVTEMQFARNS
jgi:hypothetical protein